MSSTEQLSFTEQGIPTYQQFVLPAIRAVAELGGSAKTQEITDHIVGNYPDAEDLLQVTYPKRPEVSVFTDRASWGRSAAKLIGALEQPSRGIYLTTNLGEQLLSLPEEEAYDKVRELIREMNREYDRQQHRKKSKGTSEVASDDPEDPSAEVIAETEADDDNTGGGWKTQLLARLHKLSPEGFEKFVLYLLRQYGLTLEHRGASGDEGIDGIGIARFSPPFSPPGSSSRSSGTTRMAPPLVGRSWHFFAATHKPREQSELF